MARRFRMMTTIVELSYNERGDEQEELFAHWGHTAEAESFVGALGEFHVVDQERWLTLASVAEVADEQNEPPGPEVSADRVVSDLFAAPENEPDQFDGPEDEGGM